MARPLRRRPALDSECQCALGRRGTPQAQGVRAVSKAPVVLRVERRSARGKERTSTRTRSTRTTTKRATVDPHNTVDPRNLLPGPKVRKATGESAKTWARKRAARTEAPVDLQCGQAEVNSPAAVPLFAGGRSTQIFCPFFVNKSGIARLRRAVLRTAENPLALSPWRPVRLRKIRFSETAATRPSEVVEKCAGGSVFREVCALCAYG